MPASAAPSGPTRARLDNHGAAPSPASVRQRATELVRTFTDARADSELVVVEGFHALKHALRFGAAVSHIVCCDRVALGALIAHHAPELGAGVEDRAEQLPREQFRRLGPYEPHTGVVSIATRTRYDAQALLDRADAAPVVLLDDPRHRGNFGAVIRVAAAADAAGVLNTGTQDPWHSVVVRGAAGLQFALPVARVDGLPEPAADAAAARGQRARSERAAGACHTDRPVVAFDPDGDEFVPGVVPTRALLAFGSERSGLSDELHARADMHLRLPMREGVSSLNLATTVAAVLYSLRLSAARPRPSADPAS